MYQITIRKVSDDTATKTVVMPCEIEGSNDPIRNSILEAVKQNFGEQTVFLFMDDKAELPVKPSYAGVIAKDTGHSLERIDDAVCFVKRINPLNYYIAQAEQALGMKLNEKERAVFSKFLGETTC